MSTTDTTRQGLMNLGESGRQEVGKRTKGKAAHKCSLRPNEKKKKFLKLNLYKFKSMMSSFFDVKIFLLKMKYRWLQEIIFYISMHSFHNQFLKSYYWSNSVLGRTENKKTRVLWPQGACILGVRSEGWGGQKVWPCRALPSLEGLEKKSSLIWPKLNKLTLAFMFRTDRRKTGWKQGGQSGVIPITPMGGNGTKLVLLLKRYRENVRRCFSSKHFNTDLLI